MKKVLLVISLTLFVQFCIFSQEEQWTPQKHVTGYVSVQGEYIDGLDLFERNYGASLAEAGFLFNYQPLQKLTFKSVFVYRPGLIFDQMLNEASAEWKFNDNFKVTTGRFLTPLSPVNKYFYAPMNLGVALPMMVSHHEMYPLKIDGVSFSASVGDKYKLTLDAFGGGYFTTGYLSSGPTGFFGKEDMYTEALENGVTEDFDVIQEVDLNLLAAIGGRIGFLINDVFQLGVNGFYGGSEKYYDPYNEDIDDNSTSTKGTFGIDVKLKLSTFQISGEQWMGKVPVIEEETDKIAGGFCEISNTFGKFTPYVKIERHDYLDLGFSRFIGGLNFKPIFETTIKLEYFRFNFSGNDEYGKYGLNGGLLAVVYSF